MAKKPVLEHMRVPAFVLSVAAIAILANFGLELATEKFPQFGLQRFTAFTHKGSN